VVGEAVDLAHALCDTAQVDQVLMTAKTLAVVGARFDVSPLGERSLGAPAQKLAVFEVLDEDSDSGTLSGVRGLSR
jgi:class 3 adenylate cyclase